MTTIRDKEPCADSACRNDAEPFSFEALLAWEITEPIGDEPNRDSWMRDLQRAMTLEDLYAVTASFVTDCAVYDGTPREDKYRAAFLRHRLPILRELVARLQSLSSGEFDSLCPASPSPNAPAI